MLTDSDSDEPSDSHVEVLGLSWVWVSRAVIVFAWGVFAGEGVATTLEHVGTVWGGVGG